MNESIPPGYKKTEIGIIPEDWEVKRLGEIGEITGAGVDKKIKRKEIPVRLLNYLDVYNRDFLYNREINFWTTAPKMKIKQCNIRKGDVFFTPSSETQTDIAISAVAMEDMPGVVYSYHIVRFRIKENWDLKFRTYIFKTRAFLSQAERMAEGSGKRYVISLKKFRELEIFYPPTLTEQRAIARILSDIDELIESIDKLIEKKKLIKKGAMQQLLTGKKRLPGFKGEWVRKRLGEVGNIITGGTPPTKIKKYWNGKIPWITPTDISEKKDIYDSERKITKEGQKLVGEIPENTLLVTCIASIGKNAILRVNGACNQQINAVIPDKNYNVDFLYYTLEFNSKRLFEMAGTTATPIISKSEFSQYKITLPPTLAEQKAIAQILSDMDAEIEALERKKQKYEMIKKGMMELLLTGKVRVKEENGKIKRIGGREAIK